jgi:TetR/AcrR family transcriptional regulator, transcriptional repressor for nem operon
MKVSREQFAANRSKILEAASRLFREKGFDGAGLDAVMQAAGLTHGAFYSHFKSKDELVAHACAHALAHTDESWRTAPSPTNRLARLYLADDHCVNRAGGCAFAALGSEVVRQTDDARRAVRDALRERIDALARLLDGPPSRCRAQAIATWAGLVGTLVLARLANEESLSKEILDAGRTVFGGKPARRRRDRRHMPGRTSGGEPTVSTASRRPRAAKGARETVAARMSARR